MRHPQLGNKEWLAKQVLTRTQREIADEVGCSAPAVSLACKRHGIKVPHRAKYRYNPNKSAAVKAGLAKRYPDGHPSGPDHPRWKGGKYRGKSGYVAVQKAGRRGYEHRWKMEELLGRPLLRTEEVHHVNGATDDNRTDGPLDENFRSGNLELWTQSHPAGQRVADKVDWAVALLKLYAPEKLRGG